MNVLPSLAALAPSPARTWLISGLLRQGDVMVASGRGAELVVRHLAVHLAGGALHWAEHDVATGKMKVTYLDRRYSPDIGSSLHGIGITAGLEPRARLSVSRAMLHLGIESSRSSLVKECRENDGPSRVLILDDLSAALGRLNLDNDLDAARVLDSLTAIQARLDGCTLIILTSAAFFPDVVDVTLTTRRTGQAIEATVYRVGDADRPRNLNFRLTTFRGLAVPVHVDNNPTDQ